MKKIIICADDYAQNETISQAILNLIQLNRISAVSCMTESEFWEPHGKRLRAVSNDIDVGLHFDLTHFNRTEYQSFAALILASCSHQINATIIIESLSRQLDAFENIMGRQPDYIDGHQHVHILPSIRNCLFETLKHRYGNKLPYLRNVSPRVLGGTSPFKAMVLRLLAFGFRAAAKKNGFALSKHFFGMYSLKPMPYRQLFKTWLKQAPNGSLFMCHPGFISNDPRDPIKSARIVENDYLASNEFLHDLNECGAKICRWQPD